MGVYVAGRDEVATWQGGGREVVVMWACDGVMMWHGNGHRGIVALELTGLPGLQVTPTAKKWQNGIVQTR